MKSLFSKAALVLALMPVTLAAQSGRVDGTRLQLGVDTMTIHVIRGTDTTKTGMVIDAIASGTVSGQRLLLRVYGSSDLLFGSRLDSLTDRESDLSPVRQRSVSIAGREVIEFIDGKATGWRRPMAGDSTAFAVTLPIGAINASSFDLFLRAAPLDTGYEVSFPAFVGLDGTVITLTARVADEERILGADCWRIEAKFAGMPVTFWVTKQGRHLQQQVLQMQPDLAMLYRRTVPTS